MEHNAVVIYGDTDSVMIDFGVKTVTDAIKLGKNAASYVNSKFPDSIHIEFEKVYFPYLLMKKKRYAGLLWTKPDKYDKLDVKGIETVRRDNCGLVRHTIDTCLKKILIENKIEESKQFVRNIIRDLLCNRIDLSLLVITKSLSKDKYINPTAHSLLTEKMRQRDPETAPAKGDRVPFDRAEDPIYVLNNGLTIDANYYLNNQLIKPLKRIFTPILQSANVAEYFLHGEHTLQRAKSNSKKGLITKFAQVVKICLACRIPIKDDKNPICKECISNAPEIYQRYLNKVRIKEREFSRLWTQCQDCQGSYNEKVLCTARDCPIFYMRTQVQQELKDANKVLDQFNDW